MGILGLDVIWTLIAIRSHMAIEANPLMQSLLNLGVGWFVLVKALPVMILFGIKRYLTELFWVRSTWVAFAAYVFLYIVADLKINLG